MRGLSGSVGGRLELPCLVDQSNCGEVYYITWTKSSANISSSQQQQQQWQRVYLYTGANDSSPHKPIGELANRAQFHMPTKRQQQPQRPSRDDELAEQLAAQAAPEPPMARLVIEQPRLSDEALYKCDVTYVKGKCPSISLVRVQMMALPAKAQISLLPASSPSKAASQSAAAAANQLLEDGQLIGPLREREQLRLACRVLGGRPAPRAIIWRRIDPSGGRTNLQHEQSRPISLTDQQQPVVEVHLNHTLTSADLGAKFECHVEHEALDVEPRLIRTLSAKQPTDQQPDSLLDLHPSRPAEQQGLQAEQQQLAIGGRAPALDAHVFIDLNGEFFQCSLSRSTSSLRVRSKEVVATSRTSRD